MEMSFSEVEKMVFTMKSMGKPIPVDGTDPFPSKYGRPFTEMEKHWYRILFGDAR